MNRRQFFESFAGKGHYEKEKDPRYRLVMLEVILQDDVLRQLKSVEVHLRKALEAIEKMEEENDYLQWFYDLLTEYKEDTQLVLSKVPEFVEYIKYLHQVEPIVKEKTMDEAQEERWKKNEKYERKVKERDVSQNSEALQRREQGVFQIPFQPDVQRYDPGYPPT